MTARLTFRLLGPFSVRMDGRVVRQSLTGPAQSLLIYLLLHQGQRHRREALMAQVWDGADAPSRPAFNTALWRLRKFLEPLEGAGIEQDGDTLRLTLGPDVTCDAADLLARVPKDAPLSPGERDGLNTLVRQWRGPFAEGLDQHWVLAARERMHNAYLQALSALMRDAGDREQFEQALDFGQRILTEDPFREGVHCEMLWLWVLTGQRVKAIKAHRAFCALLREELDIGPVAETTALFDYIQNGLEAVDASVVTPRDGAPVRLYKGYLAALAEQRSEVYASLRRQAAAL